MYLEMRYGPVCRTLYACLSLLMYIFAKISVALYAGGIVLQTFADINLQAAAVGLVVVSGIYTSIGGASAVIYTEVMQTLVLIVGGLCVLGLGLQAVGGWEALRQRAPAHAFHMVQDGEGNWPPLGVLFGLPYTSIYYWCTDQVIVQRALSARGIHHSQGGILLACTLKLLLPFIMLVPGIISSVMSESVRADPNTAFPALIISVIPSPLMGVICAAVLAALMSSIASVFSSGATIFTIDIYSRWMNPSASDQQKIRVGRAVTVAMTVAGILWIPVISLLSKSLYIYTHKIMSYYAPPITVIFVLGVVWQRANSVAAATAFITGMCIGTLRLLTEVLYAPSTGVLGVFAHGNFLYFSACHGAFIIVLVAVVSLATHPPPPERTRGLTWSSRQQAVSGVIIPPLHENSDSVLASGTNGLEMPALPVALHHLVADESPGSPSADSVSPRSADAASRDDDEGVGLIRANGGVARVQKDRMSAELVLRLGGFVRSVQHPRLAAP